jgi:cytochrome P450
VTASHCPAFEFDPTDPELSHRDQELYAAVRAAGPAAWSALHGGHWVVTGHELCRAVAADQRRFSSASGVHVPPTGLFERGVPIFALEHDPPEHRDQRQLLRQAAGESPSRVPETLIRERARKLLEGLDWSGQVDLMNDFANPLPLGVIFAVTGADAEFEPEMKALVDALFFHRQPVPGTEDPAGRIIEIAGLLVGRRRREPKGDWISQLINSEIKGIPLTDEQVAAAIVALITGGHHSTSRGLGSLIARMLTVPGLQSALRTDPARIPAAIDETLRLHTPLPSFSRRATTDTRIGGADIRAGEDVLMIYAAANRDPAVFDRPDEFEFGRSRRDSLAFGYGPHRCIGVYLATAELRIALQELFAVTPWLELEAPVRWLGPAEPAQLQVRLSEPQQTADAC